MQEFVEIGLPGFSVDRFRFTRLFELLKDIKQAKVLEIGCGSGEMSKVLSQNNKVFAMDLEDNSENFRDTPIKFLQHDLNKPLPFEDNVFDYVLAVEVLEHVQDLDRAIKEISRVLKQNGIFIMEVPNWSWNLFCDLSYPLLRSYSGIKKRFERKKSSKKIFFISYKLQILDIYAFIVDYCKKFHIHRKSWRWWRRKVQSFQFEIVKNEGIHINPLLSFFPNFLQKKIYKIERKFGESFLINTFSCNSLFIFRKTITVV